MDTRSRHLLSIGLVANAFEWYDFTLTIFLAGTIGQLFFAADTALVGLAKGYFVFGVSHLARPLGSLFFGLLGDRKGNLFVLKCSVMLMAAPTALIGLLPTYAQAGVSATLTLLVLRLIQGFAMGAELPSSGRYVFENASAKSRSVLCGVVMSSTTIGGLLGSGVVTSLGLFFDAASIQAWAWRIPFLLSIPLTFFIISLRTQLYQESVQEINAEKESSASSMHSKALGRLIAEGMVVIAFSTICFYTTLMWMPGYLTHFLNIDAQLAKWMNTMTLLATLPLYPCVGYAAYRWGYLRILEIGIVALSLGIFPILINLQLRTSWPMLLLLQILLAWLFVIVNTVTIELLTRLFPKHQRSLGVNLAWTLPSSLLGGPTPWIYTQVLQRTHWHLFPAYYIAGFGILAFVVVKGWQARENRK